MFTGIIETIGTITDVYTEATNTHFWVSSNLTPELKIDQSVSHNGVCLTVVEIKDDTYRVTAIDETLQKTNLGSLSKGHKVNLERAMLANSTSRLDGHFVQGHVDATAECISVQEQDGSWLYHFRFPVEYAALVIEKGSICINGVSLTVFDIGINECTVAIIPYTYEHTTFHTLQTGNSVNIEFDVLGKYILRYQQLKGQGVLA